MKVVKRRSCCICGGSDLQEKLRLGKFPIYIGTIVGDPSDDLFFDQIWAECGDCGCLQLLELPPANLVYQSNHNFDVVGNVWKFHHDSFANFIAKKKYNKIIEIGASHGYLANRLIDRLGKVEYTIVEPNSNLNSSRIKVITGYIEEYYSEISKKDCIIHSHVLEHMYNPVEFVDNISRYAEIGADIFVSIPNFKGFIDSGALNSLNFEHTFLLDPKHAELMFENAGFLILNSKNYLNHSFFYHLKKSHNALNAKREFSNISLQSSNFLDLISNLRKFVELTNIIIDDLSVKEERKIYLFGANIFSQGLVTLGINQSKITGILDNSPNKQNQRLYGTNLIVQSPSIIAEHKNVYVVLKASHYQNEIRDQLKYLNKNVVIIEN